VHSIPFISLSLSLAFKGGGRKREKKITRSEKKKSAVLLFVWAKTIPLVSFFGVSSKKKKKKPKKVKIPWRRRGRKSFEGRKR